MLYDDLIAILASAMQEQEDQLEGMMETLRLKRVKIEKLEHAESILLERVEKAEDTVANLTQRLETLEKLISETPVGGYGTYQV